MGNIQIYTTSLSFFSKLRFQLSTEYNTNIDGDIIYAGNCSEPITNITSLDLQNNTMGLYRPPRNTGNF